MTSTLATATFATSTCGDRAARTSRAVFGRFDALQPGQALQLVNDHDPQPLRSQFDDRRFGQFEWAALEAGPVVWRVQITRIGAGRRRSAGDSCCSGGACCG